jgi:hypothetical protein
MEALLPQKCTECTVNIDREFVLFVLACGLDFEAKQGMKAQ